jgi:SAM-dependent methyltransferase
VALWTDEGDLAQTAHVKLARMAPVPDGPAGPAKAAVANDYDTFAVAYAAENETSLANAYYERPAILALAGDVAGRRILDAGCGSGPLSAALRDRGAIVTGIDSSAKMVGLARQRLGTSADVHIADLGNPLPFPDRRFDDVIASLVLHYLEDWVGPLAELWRVLKPGGRLIVSVDHPIVFKLLNPGADYFATRRWSFEWTLGGQTALMSFWHRPLRAMTDAFTEAGFRISLISEPQPVAAARNLFPEEFHRLTTNPSFVCFVLEAV